VDVEYGAVNIYVGFPGLDRASKEPAPDSHLFRVEKGMLRYIHTISTCEGHPGCGLNGTYVPIDGGKVKREATVVRRGATVRSRGRKGA